jgi:hypothetical protein
MTSSDWHFPLPCHASAKSLQVGSHWIFLHSTKIGMTCASVQLGPQQLKYMTVLKDSSDRLSFSSLALLITIAEVEGERLLAWDTDLRWFLAFCCADLMTWFHLQIPSWSFMASTTPTLAATKALLVWLIFYIYTLHNSLLNLLFNLKTTNSTN